MKELEVSDIHSFYGKSHILFGISLSVPKGSVVGLIGRNGAGKSTTLKSIIGLVTPMQGVVVYRGEKISGLPPYQIARKGVGYVPEDRRVFSDLTVKENLEIMTRVRPRLADGWSIEKIFDFFPVLARLSSHRGMELSGGEQQMLTIARTLMLNPSILLLDEPTEGLAPIIVSEIQALIKEISKETTILLAEQNLKFVLNLINYAYVIDQGKIVYEGSAEQLEGDREARERFLGVNID